MLLLCPEIPLVCYHHLQEDKMLTAKELKRYEQHICLPGFGVEKQELLKGASVLVVGAGGLGCPVLLYLAAAGVGRLGIVDDDVVNLTNLQRQILFTTKDLGRKKALAASEKLWELNPNIEVDTWCERLTNANALDIIRSFDIIADCSDNIATRYMISDACVLEKKTLISGSVFRFEGQVVSLNCPLHDGKRSPDYRSVFPDLENRAAEIDCATAGVLGVVPGIIGCMQANEIIRFITEPAGSITPQLIAMNVRETDMRRLNIPDLGQKGKSGPKSKDEFRDWKYVDATCELSAVVSPEELSHILLEDPHTMLVDVRMPNEYPEAEGLSALNIPLPLLENSLEQVAHAERIIVFCKSGSRSEKAMLLLKVKFPGRDVRSLAGGIESWNDYYEKNNAVKK